jgi:hypothetical protein
MKRTTLAVGSAVRAEEVEFLAAVVDTAHRRSSDDRRRCCVDAPSLRLASRAYKRACVANDLAARRRARSATASSTRTAQRKRSSLGCETQAGCAPPCRGRQRRCRGARQLRREPAAVPRLCQRARRRCRRHGHRQRRRRSSLQDACDAAAEGQRRDVVRAGSARDCSPSFSHPK